MKFAKFAIATTALGLASVAFAADPIEGNWQMSENGQPKATVTISKDGNGYKGVVTSAQTEKAKAYVNKQVLFNITPQGNGKYSAKGKDPRWGIVPAVPVEVTLNGKNLTVKSKLKGSQTWTKK